MTRRWAVPAAAGVLSALLALSACDRDGDDGLPEPGVDTAFVSAEAGDLGFDPEVLERLADSAQDAGSTCFLVARNGQIAGEAYWRGAEPDSAQEVFSVTKSITGALVGIADKDGALALNDRASRYIREWRATRSAAVTVRNLMSNDSGRFWDPASDYGDLIQAKNRTGYAVGLSQQARPGKVWAYNNAAIQTLDRVLVSATGTTAANFAQYRLFGPLGMEHTRMTPDAAHKSTNAFFGMQSTCRDLARFGQLFAQGGEWDGQPVLEPRYVADATAQSSQKLNAAYGLLWWVNRDGPQRKPIDEDNPGLPPGVEGVGQLAEGAPEELFAALGYGGQTVLVDPLSQTVVVRLGKPGSRDSFGYSFADAAEVITDALN